MYSRTIKNQKKNIVNYIINVAGILIALFFAVSISVQNFHELNNIRMPALIIVGFVLFLITHFIKLIRLYIIMMGMNIRFEHFLPFYIKTTFVNIMIPYKLGELFRFYCLSQETGDYKTAGLGIITERFFDTIVLFAIILPIQIFTSSHVSAFSLVLFGLLVVAFIVYTTFPALYAYFNHFWVFNRLTKRSNRFLKALEALNDLYRTEKKLVHKRAVTIIFLSVLSWGFDFGVLYIFNYVLKGGQRAGVF